MIAAIIHLKYCKNSVQCGLDKIVLSVQIECWKVMSQTNVSDVSKREKQRWLTSSVITTHCLLTATPSFKKRQKQS